ncbi:hypothetical protein KQX54_014586 [Cotesia glomerata]|uniref:G-protein coupled receptors family 1 profile domain-containing protein n=1 Tax=Cotesia glomerata TaxID=32391 RepID=A0AAV7I8U6_COTGL|nr:hypothetical protein KQX54_014586 [Cotesia glomerata]
MLTTVSVPAFELNSSFYTTAFGSSSTLEGFSVSVIEPDNSTAASTPYMLPEYIRATSMVVCITVMVLGIIGNLMVPLVVFRGKDMRNSTNIFLVNLSAADLCVLLICAPTVLVEVNSGPQVWPLGEHMSSSSNGTRDISISMHGTYVRRLEGRGRVTLKVGGQSS